jgi:ribosomal protein S18 acetylase RimI-like enzyme
MIVAIAMARPDSGKLFALFTSPTHARRGHGSALLRTVEKSLSANGVRCISLDTGKGTAAIGFYLRNGYRVTGESNDDVFMSKTLAV